MTTTGTIRFNGSVSPFSGTYNVWNSGSGLAQLIVRSTLTTSSL